MISPPSFKSHRIFDVALEKTLFSGSLFLPEYEEVIFLTWVFHSTGDLKTELSNLKNFEYKPGVKYERYTIAIVKIAINQILAFTRRALTAIGAAA